MKVCFKCGIEKELSEYYKHPQMGDGHLNKCKDCTKKDTKERTIINTSTPEGLEKERERHRDKYRRLNYKAKQKEWDKKRPWKSEQKYKNLSRKFKIQTGYELHHWNYNNKYLEDVVLMDIKSHKNLHVQLKLDYKKRIFKTKENILLDTRDKHLGFIKFLGFEYKEL